MLIVLNVIYTLQRKFSCISWISRALLSLIKHMMREINLLLFICYSNSNC